MRIKGAIFDADGTLLDSMKIWEDVGIRYLAGLGIKAPPELSNILYPMSLEESSKYLKEEYNLDKSIHEIKEGVLNIVSDFYKYEVKLKPGVKEFLAILKEKGVPMVIATTGDEELLNFAFTRLGICEYFNKIFTCSKLNTTKREPLIFIKAQEYLGEKAEDIFVFEDVFHAISSAKTAGFKTVAIEEETSFMDREKIIESADIYLKDFFETNCFWKFIVE